MQQQLQQLGLDIDKIQQVVHTRWLKPQEVLKILQNHELFMISHKCPQKPQSGSWFLFNRRVLRYFRSDGFEWQKKKNGKTIDEAHERIKVDNVDTLNCYYARGDKDPTFQRRIYWMLDPAYDHIVLVHYRDVLEGRIVVEASSRTSASESDLIQHRAALRKLKMQLALEDKEDCDVNAHPCPSAIDVLKNSDTWLEEDQLEAILHSACMTLTEKQCFKIHEVSPESAFSSESREGRIVEEASSRTSASESDLVQHRAALRKLKMQLALENKEDCDVNAHPCPSAIDVLKNSDTWLEEDQLEAILHPACMTLAENQCFKIHEVSPESAFSSESRKKRKRHHYPTSIQAMEPNILERVVAGSEEPSNLDLSFLQRITENFSEQRKIGIGGCGEVYKGILRNGVVAVKRLFKSRTVKDKMFHREVKSLITARHQNIVRFLGYCSFTEERALTFEGRTIMVDIRERLLCFEYISNGSLENHLTDELRGLEWHKRYEIIVGICMGLLYLHKEKNIVHMDLKPANILLDDLMVPKITDFGLSRLDNNSQAVTTSRFISLGYCAPEYLLEGKSSSKSDIYSLGVIITELVTGSKTKPDVTKVLRRWKHRGMKSLEHTTLGYQQVTKCLELAKRCMQTDPERRPDIVDITQELNAMDSKDDQFQEIPSLDDMLGIELLEIHFPFELEPQISHSIQLTNDTNDYIAFMTTTMLHCFLVEPDKGIVPPQSQCSVTIKMQAQAKEHELPNNHYKQKITVQSTIVDGGLVAMDITGDVFTEKEGSVVDEVNVIVVFDRPPSADEESSKDV